MESTFGAIRKKIKSCGRKEKLNCYFGHGLIVMAICGSAVAVGITASIAAEHTTCWKVFAAVMAALPGIAVALDKSLLPMTWEVWYARLAIELEIVLREAESRMGDRSGDDDPLDPTGVAAWNDAVRAAEKTRPNWGLARK